MCVSEIKMLKMVKEPMPKQKLLTVTEAAEAGSKKGLYGRSAGKDNIYKLNLIFLL